MKKNKTFKKPSYQYQQNHLQIDPTPSTMGLLVQYVEKFGKVLTILAGSIYLIGYIIVASRLAQYGVSTTRLIEAQYFAAGLWPSFLAWITVYVVVSASRVHHRRSDKIFDIALNWIAVLTLLLFLAAFGMELWLVPLSANWGENGRFAANFSYQLVRFVQGELALWFLIAGWKTKYIANLVEYFRRREGTAGTLYNILLLFVALSLIGIIRIPTFGLYIYNQLPQAYGGAKPIQVQLYLDAEKAPSELISPSASTDQSSPVPTIALNLILKTSTEYIVQSHTNPELTWVLQSNSVFAEATQSDR